MKRINFGLLLIFISHFAWGQLNFTRTDYNFNNPTYAIGDLDNDNLIDLVISNGNLIEIYKNKGNKKFILLVGYNTVNKPQSITISDLNNDGFNDIITTNNDNYGFSIFLNDKNGTFSNRTDYSNVSFCYKLEVEDLNNDGYRDLVIGKAFIGENKIYVIINDGKGSFPNVKNYVTETAFITDIDIADINNDNYNDIIVTQFSYSINLFTNDKSGNFNQFISLNHSDNYYSKISDINNDNFNDIITSDRKNSNIVVLTNTGISTFNATNIKTPNVQPEGIDANDLDSDGDNDIVVAYYSGNHYISILLNRNKGVFDTIINLATNSFLTDVKIADMDNNGKKDIIVGVFSSVFYQSLLSQTISGFNPPTTYTYSDIPFYLNATVSSGLPLAYSSSNTNIVSIAGNNAYSIGVGVVTITVSQIGNSVYDPVSINKVITITPAPLLVTINGISRMYGSNNPSLSGNAKGLVGSDLLNYSSTANINSPVGVYPISVSHPNYNITAQAAFLTVTSAPLVVKAIKATKVYGNVLPPKVNIDFGLSNPLNNAPYPSFNASVVGLKFNDISIDVNYSTNATSLSGVGKYLIYPSITGTTISNYNITAISDTLIVTPALLTVTALNASKLYAQPLPNFSFLVNGLVLNETLGSVNFFTNANSLSGIGLYFINPLPFDAVLNNYSLTTIAGILNIAPTPLTVTALNATKLYGSPLPNFTYSITGLVNNETITGVNYFTSANSISGIGNYAIMPQPIGTSLVNYDITTVSGNLSIVPIPLAITVLGTNKIYGDNNPKFTSIAQGLIFSDTVSYLCQANSLTGIGLHTISGFSANYYTSSLQQGVLTILPRPLSVTVIDTFKIYGRINPMFRSTITGLINNDVVNASYFTLANSLTGVGIYTIIPSVSGSALVNYILTTVSGNLNINKSKLYVVIDSVNVRYGKNFQQFIKICTNIANVGTNFGYFATNIGNVNTNIANVAINFGYIATNFGNVATNLPYFSTNFANVSANFGNVTTNLPYFTDNLGNVTVTLPATNFNQYYALIQKTQLSDDATISKNTLTSSIVGIINLADNIEVNYALSTNPTSGVNIYPINLTVSGNGLVNYDVIKSVGTIQILPALLTVTALNDTKGYGYPLPIFNYSVTGLVNNETLSSVNYITSASSITGIGNYKISPQPTGNILVNYQTTTVDGILNITPAPLAITVTGASKKYGEINPKFTSIAQGLIFNDTVSYITSASSVSGVGVYSIAGFSANYYTTIMKEGVLTVNPADLKVAALDKIKIYGEALPIFTGSISGLVNKDSIKVNYFSPANAQSDVIIGGYAIYPSVTGIALSNYDLKTVSGVLTIAKANQTITGFDKVSHLIVNKVFQFDSLKSSSGLAVSLSCTSTTLSINGTSLVVTEYEQFFSLVASVAESMNYLAAESRFQNVIVYHVENGNVGIFPNPNEGNFTIVAPLGASVKIITTDGKIVRNFTSSSWDEIKDLGKGYYVVRIIVNKVAQYQKLVVK